MTRNRLAAERGWRVLTGQTEKSEKERQRMKKIAQKATKFLVKAALAGILIETSRHIMRRW